MVPKECKYCGCEEVAETFAEFVYFRCGTTYWPESGMWTGAGKCVGRCAERLRELRERVQRAVEVLEGATRREFVDGFLPHMQKRRDGEWLEWDDAERAIEILRGNAPEIPDSSPITADDLAVSDYFEAVRQRVPWMTSVEHIEGLVEGYRRCGVSVWQTAEEIRKVHGGEYAKAE